MDIFDDMPKDYVPSQFFRLSIPPKIEFGNELSIKIGAFTYRDYDEIYLDKPAQQGVHLTAFGVGMLALLAGYIVFLFKLLRKYGGK